MCLGTCDIAIVCSVMKSSNTDCVNKHAAVQLVDETLVTDSARNAGRTNKGRVQLKDDAGAVTDKAYEREYLAHDRKRIRRD